MNAEIASRADRPPRPGGGRRFFLRLLAVLVVLGMVGWAAWYFLDGRWYVETDDAYVGGNIVQITSQVGGTVIRIDADDGDFVRAGQALVQLDASDTEVAMAAARAELALAVRQTRGLYNKVQAAEAEVAASRTALGKARADYRRRQGLVGSGVISAELFAHSRDALQQAESALVAAEQQHQNAAALVSGTEVASNPAVRLAEARLRKAFLDAARTSLVAPIDGHVAKRSVQVGELVAAGRPLMAVIPLEDVWVDANFKETQLAHMRIGQPVTLHSDLYGKKVTYRGTVTSLGVGTGSAFALLPAQNATGNWIKVVQRLPVRIVLDHGQLEEHPLRVGLSMTARVDIHERGGALLATVPPTRPVASTDVYAQQLAEVDSLIAEIVQANLGPDGSP